QAESQAGIPGGGEVAPGLCRIERAALEEDVGRFGHLRRFREDLGEGEVEIAVCVQVLRWYSVRAEPGRDPAGRADRPELGELGVPVESVAGLRLERRRPLVQHPAA